MRPRILTAALCLIASAILAAQQAPAPTPEDLTNQIDQHLKQAGQLNDQLRTMLQPCTFAVAPAAVPSVQAAGDTLTFQVTTTGHQCGWSAVSADPWATLAASSGTDSGPATVLVAANLGPARSTAVTIAGVTIPISQDAPPPPSNPPVTTAAEFASALQARQAAIKVQGTMNGNWTIDYGPVVVECPTAVAAGARVTPADVTGGQFVAGDPLRPVLTVARNGAANDVTIQGCTLTGVAGDRTLFVAGSGSETDVTKQPRNLTLDRNAFLGVNGRGHRGVELHTAGVVVTGNYIAGFLEQGRQSQGLWAGNGPGPYLIDNNYIEGSGQNILFGGDDPRIQGLIPSDITIRNNLLFKPQAWRTQSGSVANILELKNARRVVIEHNIMDGNWKDIQVGIPVLFTVRNQYGGCPWCQVDDVVFRGNIVRNTPASFCINILGTDDHNPSAQIQRITIDHNLCEDAPSGVQINAGVAQRLTVTNNTFPAIKGRVLYYVGLVNGQPRTLTPSTIERNVTKSGAYGIYGEGGPNPGAPTLDLWTGKSYSCVGNVAEKGDPRVTWPTGNTILAAGGLAPLLDAAFHYTPDPSLGW